MHEKIKERLVKLLQQMSKKLQTQGGVTWYDFADHLIDHGVTLQKWFSATNPPQEDERVLVWLGNNRYNDVKIDTDRVHNGKWVRWGDCVTHWAPIGLRQPPPELNAGVQDDES